MLIGMTVMIVMFQELSKFTETGGL